MHFEAVQSFEYLGNIIANTNNNTKCITDRIMMGDKAYYANRQLVNSIKKQPVADIPHSGTPSGHLWLRMVDTHRGRGKSVGSI
jgi:hypothetical protein